MATEVERSGRRLPPCCVCGDSEVPRRVVLAGRETDVPVASVCEDAQWCQARAAANRLDGLASAGTEEIGA